MRKVPFMVAVLFAAGGDAGAQSPPPGRHAMHLIKLPNGDYTVPMSELRGSGTSGKVTLHPVGMKTLVTVSVTGGANRKHAFNLHSGKDCGTLGAANAVALAPALTGQPSKTLVTLPIGDFTSKDYVVDAENANAREQFREACARL